MPHDGKRRLGVITMGFPWVMLTAGGGKIFGTPSGEICACFGKYDS